MASNSRYYPSMQLASKQMNIQAELSSVGGTDSEQYLITKALGTWRSYQNDSTLKYEFTIRQSFT